MAKECKGAYFIAYFNDRPYNEGIELWFRTSIAKLKKVYHDWMEERSSIYVCKKWETKADYISDSFDKEKVGKYRSITGDLPNEIYYCKKCWIFYNYELKHCKTCNKECFNAIE